MHPKCFIGWITITPKWGSSDQYWNLWWWFWGSLIWRTPHCFFFGCCCCRCPPEIPASTRLWEGKHASPETESELRERAAPAAVWKTLDFDLEKNGRHPKSGFDMVPSEWWLYMNLPSIKCGVYMLLQSKWPKMGISPANDLGFTIPTFGWRPQDVRISPCLLVDSISKGDGLPMRPTGWGKNIHTLVWGAGYQGELTYTRKATVQWAIHQLRVTSPFHKVKSSGGRISNRW